MRQTVSGAREDRPGEWVDHVSDLNVGCSFATLQELVYEAIEELLKARLLRQCLRNPSGSR